MEFQFSVEVKQEGQIKEPGIFNLVLSAQRHTHRASSWDKGGSSFLKRGPQAPGLCGGSCERHCWSPQAFPFVPQASTFAVLFSTSPFGRKHRTLLAGGTETGVGGGSHSRSSTPCLPRSCGLWGVLSRPLQNVLPFPYRSITSLPPPTTSSLIFSLFLNGRTADLQCFVCFRSSAT